MSEATQGQGGGETARAARGTELALALLFAFTVNLPMLGADVVPFHDTAYNFANFHYFYSELAANGTLARWIPYGTYGLPADYEQIIALAPASYLVAIAGVLLGATNALLLFKLAALLEVAVFVLGVFLLARRLFGSRATVLALSLAAAGTTVWYAQQWWDLRIYYLLPLLLHFFASFLDERRPRDLWLAGITAVAWAIGNLFYLIPLWAYLLLVVGAIAASDRRDALRALLRPSLGNVAGALVFAAAAFSVAWLVLHAGDHSVMRVTGREASGRVDLETFRSYGGNANLVIVANSLLFGWPLQLRWGTGADNSLYVGLLPVLGFALALAIERSRWFLGLAFGVVFLAWLSIGGAFTSFAYHLPGFGYFRHVGLTFGLVKVLILIAAGFGLERLWRRAAPARFGPVVLVALAAIAIEVLWALPGAWSGAGPRPWIESWGSHVLLRLFVYAAALAATRALRVPIWRGLLLALVFDIGLFQYAIAQLRIGRVAPDERANVEEVVRVRPIAYQAERSDPPPAESPGDEAARLRRLAWDFVTRPSPTEVYWYAYPFAGFDPCRSQFRTDLLPAGVDRLLALARALDADPGVLVGCGTPKLGLSTQATITRSTDESRLAVQDLLRRRGHGPPVVQLPPGVEPPPRTTAQADAGRVSPTAFGTSMLEAEVVVTAEPGAWLIYADAFHPGWRATLDGVEAPVREANLAFKAVWVPTGRHLVGFAFDQSASHWAAWAVAAIGAASALAALGYGVAVLLGGAVPVPRHADAERA